MESKNTIIIEEQEDRFTSLPDVILLHILSFLDTNFSIRTCLLLSKRSVNLWTFLPNLIFNISSFYNQRHFHDFVSNVLQQNSLKINRLSFSRVCNFEDHELLDKVIRFSICNGVEELNLTLNHWTKTGDYLEMLMNSCSLQTLALRHRVSFDRPLRLTRLTSLFLKHVVLNEPDMFSGCLNLKVLSLISCVLRYDLPLSVLNVFSPNLTELTISDCDHNGLGCQYEIVLRTPRLEVFRIENGGCPPLIKTDQLAFVHNVEVHYSFFEKGRNDVRCLNVVKMLQSFRNAESITLSMSILKLLSLSPDILVKEPSPFDKLRHLTIVTLSLESVMSAPMKNYLFKNSPHAKIAIKPPRLYPFGEM